MDLKTYWNKRVEKYGPYRSIGSMGYSDFINKQRKKIKFKTLNKIFASLNVDLTNKNILDAGCGTGIYSKYCLSKGAKVFAVDFSDRAIDYVLKNKLATEAKVVDLTALPFVDNFFDITLCFSVLYHIINNDGWKRGIKELARVTKRGGLVILQIEWVKKCNFSTCHQKFRPQNSYMECFQKSNLKKIAEYEVLEPSPKYSFLIRYLPYLFIFPFLFEPSFSNKIIVCQKS